MAMNLGLDQIQAQLEKLAKLPRAYRTALLPAVVVLVLAAYVWFLYLPAKRELEVARDQHLQLQRKLSEVGLGVLEHFIYDTAEMTCRLSGREGTFAFDLRGPSGSRAIEIVAHDHRYREPGLAQAPEPQSP